jgi:hypothetical protein
MPTESSTPERAAAWFSACAVGLAVGLIAGIAGALIGSLWDWPLAGLVVGLSAGDFAGTLCFHRMRESR